ncbi:transmembrane protein 208-like [Eriocheir sinensis]|uniref:transmembrane protein 208-like n=1 Tax=Eriocheir sinensis TaxID=95602 RepID=UPI0021C868AD|nr:transmembrane protein 208-like [Eriocheir sinensis]
MKAPKGKQGTKGTKQIMQENTDTLAFYRNMILGSAAVYFGVGMIFFTAFPMLDLTLVVLAGIVFAACYHFMSSMATPKLGSDGAILDEGCDLNIEGGIAEHVKDLVILTSGTVVLGTISSYFWLLWLLAPFRGAQMLWTNILGPWFFQEAPDAEPEERVLDKKQRKLERRMKYR